MDVVLPEVGQRYASDRLLDINALSGFLVTFGQELVYYLSLMRIGGPLNLFWWIIPPVGAGI